MAKRQNKSLKENVEKTAQRDESILSEQTETKRTVVDIKSFLADVSSFLKEKIRKIRLTSYREKIASVIKDIKSVQWKQKLGSIQWKKIRNIRWQQAIQFVKGKKIAVGSGARKVGRWVSDFWKIMLVAVSLFLIFYYSIGGQFAENIDVKTGYQLQKESSSVFETAQSMSFLIKREVDEKMWTPNLPVIFPAYVLDNMPNFQIGILSAVKDIASAMRKFENNTEAQNKNIRKAYELLSYSPKVWLMSRQGTFKLAPSSNSQYRKAAKELYKFNHDGTFVPLATDLDKLLRGMGASLMKIVRLNEEYQQEKSGDWLDTKADDLFYYAKGYAFATWQMSRVISVDFRTVIIEKDLYEEWTYLVSALQKAAEFEPLVVRNGSGSALFTPNHLIMQSHYLLKAAIVAENMRRLLKEGHDNQN